LLIIGPAWPRRFKGTKPVDSADGGGMGVFSLLW